MAKNDKLLIDGIIDDRIEQKLPSAQRDEAFEYFAFEQILKDADLSRDEIESGWVDGRKDGGIDGFFILVNGNLLQDPESFVWPRTGSDLCATIITCKHHDTFKQATLDNLAASLAELLDFGIGDGELKGAYSESIIRFRNNLKLAYRKLSPRMSRFTVECCYASRGDTTDIGEEVLSRAEQIKAIARDSFGSCVSDFKFYGSTELVELHRRMPNYSLELPFIEVLSRGERYVLLAKLEDYFNFISDDNKVLRRYLFDSNVRDFMGMNRVNEDIKDTLSNAKSPDFWCLNNGVTILATAASVVGKSILVHDIQIVNGLQTSESIYRHFSNGGNDPDDRSVLVKIIVSRDEAVRDSIIRATNNQTDVELASLHATDKIQRDIEERLLRRGLFYERRKNYYTNLGHSPSEIVTPLYIASGYVSMVLKLPYKAAALKSKFMRSEASYGRVFSSRAPLDVWANIAIALKRTDEVLEEVRPADGGITDRFLKSWRQIVCFLTLSRIFGKFDFSEGDLALLDMEKVTKSEIRNNWDYIKAREYGERKKGWILKTNVLRLCKAAEKDFEITGYSRIEHAKDLNSDQEIDKSATKVQVDMDFALKVKNELPTQPWKPGMHRKIVQELNCSTAEYFAAVSLLIDEGLVNRQRDGVVYDAEGNVLCFDPDRVDPDSLELLE